jgi:preprotein translocase SecE subunit
MSVEKKNPILEYIKKSYEELEKVTWLTKKQMVQLSIIVIIISAIVTGLLALLDYLFSSGYIYLVENLTN